MPRCQHSQAAVSPWTRPLRSEHSRYGTDEPTWAPRHERGPRTHANGSHDVAVRPNTPAFNLSQDSITGNEKCPPVAHFPDADVSRTRSPPQSSLPSVSTPNPRCRPDLPPFRINLRPFPLFYAPFSPARSPAHIIPSGCSLARPCSVMITASSRGLSRYNCTASSTNPSRGMNAT